MLLMVFGAGASFDAVAPEPYGLLPEAMPPLANGLFDHSAFTRDAIAAFPPAAPVVAHMRNARAEGGDVEQELRRLLDEADQYPDRLRHLMATRCYLRRVIEDATSRVFRATAGVTNYASLVDVARRWASRTGQEVACVTFNYDTLLEQAVEASFGIRYDRVESYIRSPWPLYKPHGSTDWSQLMEWNRGRAPTQIPSVIDAAPSLVPTQRFVHRDESTTVIPGCAWAPGLAVPLAEKSEFACPPQHLDHLKENIARVDRLLIVGWRAREAHFREWLAALTPGTQVLITAESEPAAWGTAKNLPFALRQHVSVMGRGFSSLPLSRQLREFLGD